MDSKSTEHVRPPLRRRPAKAITSVHEDDMGKQDTTSVAAASQAPGICGLDKSESPNLVGLSRSVIPAGALKNPGKSDLKQENQSKSGRVRKSDPWGNEVFPLGRRRARGFRKGESSSQKHVDDVRLQTKKAALLCAQQAGATGNFKSLDSQFNNFLIPVVPAQFLVKPK